MKVRKIGHTSFQARSSDHPSKFEWINPEAKIWWPKGDARWLLEEQIRGIEIVYDYFGKYEEINNEYHEYNIWGTHLDYEQMGKFNIGKITLQISEILRYDIELEQEFSESWAFSTVILRDILYIEGEWVEKDFIESLRVDWLAGQIFQLRAKDIAEAIRVKASQHAVERVGPIDFNRLESLGSFKR